MKKLLLFITLMVSTLTAAAYEYIGEIMVSTNSNESSAKTQLTSGGYTVVNVDINSGGGGNYVYLGYKTTTGRTSAITDIIIVQGTAYAGTENKTITVNGKTYYAAKYSSDSKGGNLNRGRGASATDLYIYYTKDGNSSKSTAVVTALNVLAPTTVPTSGNYALLYNGGMTSQIANMNDGGSAKNATVLSVTKHTCTTSYTTTASNHAEMCPTCQYVWVTTTAAHTFGSLSKLNDTYCHRYCTVCKYEQKVEHSTGTMQISPNQHYKVCSFCNGFIGTQSHTYSAWKVIDENTHQHTCTVCYYTPAASSHKFVIDEEGIPATCTSFGYMEKKHCQDCNYSTGGYQIKMLAHTSTYHPYQAPTCTSAGNKEYYYCSTCKKNYYNADGTVERTDIIIPLRDHTPGKNLARPATCTTTGEGDHWQCSRCSQYFSDQACTNQITTWETTPTLPHTPGENLARPATCATTGKEDHWRCATCSQYFSDETCTTVIDNLDDIMIAKLPHTFTENGFCSICDDGEPAVLETRWMVGPDNDIPLYYINNAGQLKWFAKQSFNTPKIAGEQTKNIVYNENIFLENGTFNTAASSSFHTFPGIGLSSYNRFSGIYNGNGFTIKGLYVKITGFGADYAFINGADGAEICNVILEEAYINGNNSAIFAYMVYNNTHIRCCGVMNSNIQNGAGLIWNLASGSIEQCFFYNKNNSFRNLVNTAYGSEIKNCYNANGAIALNGSYTTPPLVENCYGTYLATNDNLNIVGGGVVSKARIESGEVCTKLNSTGTADFRQWLGRYAYPSHRIWQPAVKKDAETGKYYNDWRISNVTQGVRATLEGHSVDSDFINAAAEGAVQNTHQE